MQLSDFDFHLPSHLIAQAPTKTRSGSRLLCLQNTGDITHHQFTDFVDFLTPDDLLIFNNTKVMPARFFGKKATGGRVEVLVERLIDEHTFLAHVRASKAPGIGATLYSEADDVIEVLGREDDLFRLHTVNKATLALLTEVGHMPLPPYIQRPDNEADLERYQTVYAQHLGAVAAPTAGLHFDEQVFSRLKDKSIATAQITLHVGAGTFQPVRVDNIAQHKMHKEYISVPQSVCDQILATKARGGRVIAVGTTVVRALEAVAQRDEFSAYTGDTDIFIYPGYEYKIIDALLTNFHLPQSSLLMLVSAFIGYDNLMHAYQAAIADEYRFFSYGDAMFIPGKLHAI